MRDDAMTAYEKMDTAAATGREPAAGIADDAAMLRAAADLTRDIATARAAIYWPDCLLSAAVGYAALAGTFFGALLALLALL